MTAIARILLTVLVLAPAHAAAQAASSAPAVSTPLLADGPIVYGHHHVNASDLGAHKKFWGETLGGTVVRIGTDNREVIRIQNVWVFLRMQAPTAGSKGSTADHIAFSVPNLQATLDKVRANGFR